MNGFGRPEAPRPCGSGLLQVFAMSNEGLAQLARELKTAARWPTQAHFGAGQRKVARDRLTDAFGGTGDEGNFAGQVKQGGGHNIKALHRVGSTIVS